MLVNLTSNSASYYSLFLIAPTASGLLGLDGRVEGSGRGGWKHPYFMALFLLDDSDKPDMFFLPTP